MPRLWQDIGHQAVTRPGRTKHSTGFEVGKVGNKTFVFSRVMPLLKQVRFKCTSELGNSDNVLVKYKN